MSDRHNTPSRPAALLAVVFLLFLATGASGLIYQVVWQRYLLNVFGATIYSISTVLSAFMGGLALGSYLMGVATARLRRPLMVYGVVEVIVGAAALAVPWMLGLLDPLFRGLYQSFGSNFYAFSLLRFVLIFLILLVPTTLMGATLPLLAHFVSPRGAGAGLRVGLLYALNTAGAVTGTFVSGFYLIRLLGVSRTVMVAAAINVVAGVLAAVLSLRLEGRTAEMPADTDIAQGGAGRQGAARHGVALVLAAYTVSGFAALGLEVAWTRGLVFTFDLLKNTTYAFTAMLTTFLVGVALGSAVMTPFADRVRKPLRAFAAMQVLVGLAAVFSVFMLYYVCYGLGENWVRDFDNSSQGIRWAAAVAVVFLRTAGAMLLPTFCMGLAFPLAVRAVVAEGGSPGRDVGRLYALNTVGAIIGSFLAGFVLLPLLGIAWTIIFLGGAQIVAGALVYWFSGDATPGQRWAVAAVSVAAIAVAAVRLPADARFHRDTLLERVVFYKEGPLATVSVAQNTLGHRTIYVDNVGVAGTDPMLLTDQKSLAHVPMVLLRQPRSALTVGFGSGGASYSYTLYPELEHIHCVEITRTVIEASPWLVDSHKNVVMQRDAYRAQTGREPQGLPLWDDGGASGWYKSDPRYRIILDDARSYLRFTGMKYDIIATDCTDLRYKSNANLYDLEYFEICRDHITDDGMVVVWMPLAGLSPEAMRVAVRTFQRVFPNTEVFYMNNEPTHYILLLGTREPLKVDAALMAERMSRPQVAADLREIHLEQPEKMLSCFVTGRDALNTLIKGDVLNTPDNPYLEFESPRYGYGDAPLLDNLDALFGVRENPARLVAEGTAGSGFMARLEKYYEASPWIIRGHRHYREMELVQACQAYLKAREINPADRSVDYLLGFEELRRRVRGQPLDAWGRFHLAHLMAMQQRDVEAVTLFNDFLRVSALPGASGVDAAMIRRAREELAAIYERNGQPERAAQQRRLAGDTVP